MALQIFEKNGIFELEGRLNTASSRSFIIHFEHIIGTVKKVTVNIEKVSVIDASGVKALKKLLDIALRTNNKFSIIGYGCKDIYDDYRDSLVA